jgi:hypothetical protein
MSNEIVKPPSKLSDARRFGFLKEMLAGLTVSFVAISLGAAFGVMSERGLWLESCQRVSLRLSRLRLAVHEFSVLDRLHR